MLGGRKVEISTGGNFDPIPMDKYSCQILDVNLVKRRNQWKGEVEVLNYQYAVLDDKPMTVKDESGNDKEATTRGRFLWHACSPSLNKKAWLYKLAIAVTGRDLTAEEIKLFDPETLVGKQVDVMVQNVAGSDGTVYNNVVAYSKTLKALPGVEGKIGQANTVTKTTSPAMAPQDAQEADDFVDELEKAEAEDEDSEEEELKKKLAAIKAKKLEKA